MAEPLGEEDKSPVNVGNAMLAYKVASTVASAVGWPVMLVIALVLVIVGVLIVVVSAIGLSGVSAQPAGTTPNYTGPATVFAASEIPPDMLTLYQSSIVANQCPGLSWTIVAAITHLESDDNRNSVTSSAGAMGPGQFEPDTWDKAGILDVPVGRPYGEVPNGQGYGVDGNGDGIANIMDPEDAVPAEARLLCANGGGNPATLPQAIYAYNHAWWYVYGGVDNQGNMFEGVLPLAAQLAAGNLGTSNGSSAIVAAESQIGVPYVWGGMTPGVEFDCSGLTEWAFSQIGINLPRTSQAQWIATEGRQVPINQAEPGDLIFFAGTDGTLFAPGHVGIIVDPATGTMIDAPQTGENVQIESYLDFPGFVGITNPFAE